mgnify:FL=1
MTIDTPGVNTEKHSNEQNIQILKGYLSEMADIVNIYLAKIEEISAKVDSIETKLQESEGN